MPKKVETVQIRDFSDKDLLDIIADLASANGDVGGLINSQDAALRIFGIKDTGKNTEEVAYFTKCVTARFSYMARSMGILEKGEEVKTWAITPFGNDLRRTTVPQSVRQQIVRAPAERLLNLTHEVTERMVYADDQLATVMRREFTFQHQRRRRMYA